MDQPPAGTVTFLFTDIEGSTRLWQQHPDKMRVALNRHDALLSESIKARGGYIFQIIGDAFCAAFSTANDGLMAALEAQIRLVAENWEGVDSIQVRMALHTGKAEVQVGNYTTGEYVSGLTLSRTARLLSAGHGGQILLSLPTAELVRDQLPKEVSLRDLGSRRLKDLVRPEQVFQVVAPGLPTDFAPLKTLDVYPHNLPVQLSSFIGRVREMGEIKKKLAGTQLLTLTGVGGTGKTRLALQVAAELIDEYPSGVWLVELASLRDPALVEQSVASVFGVHEQPGRSLSDLLVDHMRKKQLLLILDNCEHLIEACSHLATVIMRNCPQVQILASSREMLGIVGEVSYSVPSLSLPDRSQSTAPSELINNEAVRLFVDRAMAVSSEFELTEDHARFVAQICRRLDGIPLAIELAAARVKVLDVGQIADRLDDRFRLLTGGSRTALPRQQTLWALIDWSWGLLSEPERDLLKRLAVFSGGWTLEAAEHVCVGEGLKSDQILDLLAQLANKSLVSVERGYGIELRYRLLETIRQFMREKLLEAGNVLAFHDNHLQYYLKQAERAEVELHHREQKRWLVRLETEHDNFRNALDWAIHTRPEAALRICAGLAGFWDLRGYLNEGRKWISSALDAVQDISPTPAYVEALYWAAWLAARQTDIEHYIEYQEKVLALSEQIGYQRGIAKGLHGLGLIKENIQGKPEQADILYTQSLRLWRAVEDTLGIGQALGPLAARALHQHNYMEAERLFNESLSLFRQLGDHREIAGALWNLAEVAHAQDNALHAEALASESLAIYRELEDKHGIATALRSLGQATAYRSDRDSLVSLYQESCRLFFELNDRGCLGLTLAIGGRDILAAGDIIHAQQLVWEALALTRESRDSQVIAPVLEGAAHVLRGFERWEDSTRLFGAAEAYRESVQVPLTPRDQAAHDQATLTLRLHLDRETFAQIWAEGKSMAAEHAIEYALGLPISD